MTSRFIYLVILSNLALVLAKSYPSHFKTPNYLKEFDSFVKAKDDLVEENYKLGDETKPSYYKIDLFLNQENGGRFDANVEIYFKTQVPDVKTVWLVGEDIAIVGTKENVQVYKTSDMDSNLFDSLNETLLISYQKFGFNLNSALSVTDDYVIKIRYTAKLNENTVMRGLYKSNYKQDNVTKTLFSTHFGQQARRLMPCWDENRFKAKFQLNVHRDANVHPMSISNAVQKTSTAGVDVYEPTSEISPYLLALVVADYVVNRKNAKFGVYSRPEAKNQTEFALELGPKIIQALDNWTNMSYYNVEGVDKMDIAAIPDFSAGAMENWGLLIHREVSLLYDERYATSLQKNRIEFIVAHEIAHMWFGDIVTCNYFGETWLNEGFARYFQFVAVDKIDKSYDGFTQFPVTVLQASFQPDSVSTAHALTSPGKYSYTQIRTMFDSITYDKGGSILRMTHELMGDTKFQTAIRQYLQNRKFKTAVPEDLFTELERQHPGIIDILGPYTQKGGFPLVTAIRTGNELKLTQKRFLSDILDHNDTSTWNIPITLATNGTHFTNPLSQLTIFEGRNSNITIKLDHPTLDFYILNVQQYGYYRVNYDMENWQAIGRALKSEKHGNIHVTNRAQIIDDLFNLAKIGYLKYDLVFEILRYVKNEREYTPWLATLNGLSYLQQRVSSEDVELKKMFDSFVLDILTDIYDYINKLENGSHLYYINGIQIRTWACKYGQEKCVNNSLVEFEKASNGENIKSDLKPAVYCTGLRETNTSWDKFWDMYVNTNYATEQATILTALGCSRRRIDINKLMDKILTDDIRPQDKSSAYVSAYTGNQENVDVVFNYIVENTSKWKEKMSIVSTLGDLSSRFVRAKQFDELEEFIKKLTKNEREALEEISKKNRKLLEWDKERLSELKNYLKDFGGKGTITPINFVLAIVMTAVVYLFN